MSFLRLRRLFNPSSFAAFIGFCFVGSPSCGPRRVEGDTEIMQTVNSNHAGNGDISYCQYTVGCTAGWRKWDKNLCSKY